MAEIQYLEINDITRMINVPVNLLLGVREDKDVKKLYFKCKKIVEENVDLSKHQIYVKYINALDKSGKRFDITDPKICLCGDVTTQGDYITFSWLMSESVFAKEGFIAFSVLASDGENTRWNTYPAIGTVLNSVPGGLQEVAGKYPDIITQLLNRMSEVEKIATKEAMQEYVNTYLTAHPGEIDETLTDSKKAAPADVVGQLKEDMVDIYKGGKVLASDAFRIGSYENGKFVSGSTKRITADIGYVAEGSMITCNEPNGQYYDVIVYKDTPKEGIEKLQETGWIQENVYIQGGYVAIMVANGKNYSESEGIKPSDYAMDIAVVLGNKIISENTKKIAEHDLAMNGLQLTVHNFVQAGYSEGKMYSSNIRITAEVDVQKGYIIEVYNTNGNYVDINNKSNADEVVDLSGGWKKITEKKEFYVTYDGKAYISVATAASYNSSSNINPADYACDIRIRVENEDKKEINDNSKKIEFILNGIEERDFENRGVENGKVISNSNRRLHKFVDWCAEGISFELRDDDKYMCIEVYENAFGDDEQSVIESSGWLPRDTKYILKKQGYVCVLIANNSTYSTSTQIDISDFEGYVLYKSALDSAIKEKDLIKKAFVSSYNRIGSVENHIKNFSKLYNNIGYGDGFLFFTDMHIIFKDGWEERLKDCMAYIEQIANTTPISFVLNGGDWLGSYNTQAEALYMLSRIAGTMRSKFGDKGLLLLGNHDTNYQGSISEEDSKNHVENIAARLHQKAIDNTYSSMRRRSYFRYEAPTFAMYCFDTGIETSGLSTEYYKNQVKWFAESLKTETSKHIVVAMHIICNGSNLMPLADEITKCAKMYNEKGSYTYEDITYNYENAIGKVAFAIGGHNHADSQGVANSIPYVLTINAAPYGSYSTLPFDLCAIDWDKGKLYMYRCQYETGGTIREIDILI